jgi:hypothetical protein
MANRDVVFSHPNFFDHEAYDPLAFSDVQRFSIAAQAHQECRKRLSQAQESSPISDLLRDRLQL